MQDSVTEHTTNFCFLCGKSPVTVLCSGKWLVVHSVFCFIIQNILFVLNPKCYQDLNDKHTSDNIYQPHTDCILCYHIQQETHLPSEKNDQQYLMHADYQYHNSFFVYLMTLSQLQWLRSASWHDLYRMIRKTMERYAHGLLKVLFQHLPGGAEKCHAIHQS